MKNSEIKCRYSDKQGNLLVLVARNTIGKHLGIDFESIKSYTGQSDRIGESDFDELLKQKIFNQKLGVFVTLLLDGQLRGCMGSLEANESVRKGVAHNAINAAFNDPRFPPLTAAEFARVDIEVSVLSTPEPLFFQTTEALVQQLVPARDGVVVKKGSARATFLPQVWDQLPEVFDFLNHLCIKAGLAPDEWKRPGLEVSTYQVQHFS